MAKNNYFDERTEKSEYMIKEYLMDLPCFVEEFFIGIESTTSSLTRLGYATDLRIFFNFLYSEIRKFQGLDKDTFTLSKLRQVEAYDIEKFISYLTSYNYNGKHYKHSLITKSRKLATIRSMFKYYYNNNKLDGNVASKVSMPKLHEKPIIRLESNEVFDIINETETGKDFTDRQKAYHEHTKVRDSAIIMLFLGTGIRISELVGIDIADIDFYTKSFRVTRKGGNQSILYFNDDVSIAMHEYFECRTLIDAAGVNQHAFFLSLQNRRISVRAVENLVKKYAKLVSPLKNISPHKLRSTFGTNLYRETKDIYVVAELLGHKDINVTKKHYADLGEDIKREASQKVPLY